MKMQLNLIQLRITLCALFLLLPNIAPAAVNKSLYNKWQVHNPLSKATISHQAWQDFLNRVVVSDEEGIHLIDYPHMSEKDHHLLNRYITEMSQICIQKYNRQQQLAYWLNLHNALTVQLIADYYPVNSVQEINISPGLFSVGPWRANIITVNGTRLSLDEILNHIIRPIWNDPRVHYALNNASIGSANISKQAYQGADIESQLNDAAFKYVNSLRAIQIIEGKLVVSKLYEWYQEDFGENEKDLIQHLTQFAESSLCAQLQQTSKISSYMYNWHLNSTIA